MVLVLAVARLLVVGAEVALAADNVVVAAAADKAGPQGKHY